MQLARRGHRPVNQLVSAYNDLIEHTRRALRDTPSRRKKDGVPADGRSPVRPDVTMADNRYDVVNGRAVRGSEDPQRASVRPSCSRT